MFTFILWSAVYGISVVVVLVVAILWLKAVIEPIVRKTLKWLFPTLIS